MVVLGVESVRQYQVLGRARKGWESKQGQWMTIR